MLQVKFHFMFIVKVTESKKCGYLLSLSACPFFSNCNCPFKIFENFSQVPTKKEMDKFTVSMWIAVVAKKFCVFFVLFFLVNTLINLGRTHY